jgi:hypothetical protein
MNWYEQPRIYYEWALYGQDLDEAYAQHIVQKAIDVHADTLAFCTVNGGYALWPSTVTPHYDRLHGYDLLGALTRLAHERGLRFVPWWLATASGGTACWLEQHPEWMLTGPPQADGSQKLQNYICYNTPYRDILYEEVREVLSAYPVDGIYFDQLPGSCYCASCQGKFSALFGDRMPVVTDEFFVYNSPAGLPASLRQFRDGCVREFCAGMRAIVDAVRPEAVYAQNWVRGVQAHLAADTADILLPEFYQRTDLVPLGLRMRLTKAYFDNGPIWGNVRHGVRHDARHFPVDPTRMLLMDCLASHAAPLMLDLCAMDFDTTGTEQLAATFDDMAAVQDVLRDMTPVPYAALLHSKASHIADAQRAEDAFEGLYRLLFEHHIPFEIVTEEQVRQGALQDVSVVLLPDAFALEDSTVTALAAATAAGTGLVATYTSGFADGNGILRDTPALAQLLGVQVRQVRTAEAQPWSVADPLRGRDMDGAPFHYASACADHDMTADTEAGSLFTFQGGLVLCEPDAAAQVAARAHAPDLERLEAPAVNRRGMFPGDPSSPLIVTRDHDGRRTVYVAGQVEAERRRAHAPQLDRLLLDAIGWAAGMAPPIQASDCPRTVEVRLSGTPNGDRRLILLVNQTTNPLVPSSAGPAVVRYVTPQRGLQLRLPAQGGVRVSSLFGGDLSSHVSGQELVIEIDELYLYEAILIEA